MGWRERGYSSWEESEKDKKKNDMRVLRKALIGVGAGLAGAVGLGIGGSALIDHVAAKHGYIRNPKFEGPLFVKAKPQQPKQPSKYVDAGTQTTKYKNAST